MSLKNQPSSELSIESAHTRQSAPDSGCGFQAKVPVTFKLIPPRSEEEPPETFNRDWETSLGSDKYVWNPSTFHQHSPRVISLFLWIVNRRDYRLSSDGLFTKSLRSPLHGAVVLRDQLPLTSPRQAINGNVILLHDLRVKLKFPGKHAKSPRHWSHSWETSTLLVNRVVKSVQCLICNRKHF